MTRGPALPSRRSWRTLVPSILLGSTLVLAARGGPATGSSAAAPSATASATSSSSAAVAGQKVNANTASLAELQQAFEAAGISNAARWAREVEEYRPSPTNDPSFAKLRQELAKYNPAPGVVDRIVSTLTL
jgi:hypothetical protein